MAPASRRQVASTDTLAAFDASPVYYNPRNNDDEVPSTKTSSSGAQIHGIKIGGWTIRTHNSSIGDEQSMEKLTALLEDIANTQQDNNSSNATKQRRLCPPEITFLDAFISFQYGFDRNHVNGDANSDEGRDASNLELRFNAKDALSEWAEAHKSLETERTPGYKHDTQTSLTPTERKEYRGVSILQTQDAKVWSKKPTSTVADDTINSSSSVATQSSAFYYDWTFSSPYAGTILSNLDRNNKPKALNNRQLWQPLTESHIPFHLLKDTSQPILLYDDIYFFEDDLHDNGETSLNIKIRVMPKCWYVLQRLFVRVDSVCVKCREVRYFCLINGNGTNAATLSCRPNTIYRDVTWREATWEKLKEMGMPLDPTAYMEQNTGASGGSFGGNCSTGIPSFAALLTRLPVHSVPFDLHEHSCYEFCV